MIPLAAIDRIARKVGAKRISAKALKEIQKLIEEIGFELAREAATAAKHAGRRTIMENDIKLVAGKA